MVVITLIMRWQSYSTVVLEKRNNVDIKQKSPIFKIPSLDKDTCKDGIPSFLFRE